jgi:cilia- and flagella-associated protein 298
MQEYAESSSILTSEAIDESIQNIGGALTIAFPMGLPEYEPVKYILEDDEDLTGSAVMFKIFNKFKSNAII